jgi:hypothetical protein
MNKTALILAAMLCATAAAAATPLPRSTDGSDPAGWDPRSDGPIAAPANHKVVFENDDIRIISVTVAPGAVEPAHAHLRCAVLVWDQPTPVTDHDSKGKPQRIDVWMGELSWPGGATPKDVPFIKVQPPEAAHSIANNGTKTLHLTRIEMKHGCAAPPR